MSKAVYDTRFFVESYYTTNLSTAKKLRENFRQTRERLISAIVIHEVYQLTLTREGRETAVLRATVLAQDYKVVEVDAELAKLSAELRIKYKMSMADSIIAATAFSLNATCFSDDPHFKAVKEIKTAWI